MKAAILSVIKEAVRLISELKTLCVMYYFSSEAMVGHKQINCGVTCLQTLGLEFRASPFKFSHISSVFWASVISHCEVHCKTNGWSLGQTDHF